MHGRTKHLSLKDLDPEWKVMRTENTLFQVIPLAPPWRGCPRSYSYLVPPPLRVSCVKPHQFCEWLSVLWIHSNPFPPFKLKLARTVFYSLQPKHVDPLKKRNPGLSDSGVRVPPHSSLGSSSATTWCQTNLAVLQGEHPGRKQHRPLLGKPLPAAPVSARLLAASGALHFPGTVQKRLFNALFSSSNLI